MTFFLRIIKLIVLIESTKTQLAHKEKAIGFLLNFDSKIFELIIFWFAPTKIIKSKNTTLFFFSFYCKEEECLLNSEVIVSLKEIAYVNSIEMLSKSIKRHEENTIIFVSFVNSKLCAMSDILPGIVLIRKCLIPFYFQKQRKQSVCLERVWRELLLFTVLLLLLLPKLPHGFLSLTSFSLTG